MDFSHINWLAVVAAGVSAFLVGGIWYSPLLFAKPWMADNKLNPDELKASNKGRIFGFSFFFSIIMAVNLGMFLADAKTDISWGATAGSLAGVWTFSAIAIQGLFELKSWRLIFINGGYSLVSLTLMGTIIGWWR
ncbi:DUF1761 domain-containing protein [Mucilaginibacter lappiensis]|uniref:DUF1761 domain-containing protein n=1 Tax=Mucilaginibacter lappiensis TaxID=354630 RepID=A0A1N6UAT9_9SPHI|nr:DUF1761 domain-containing protein [Mucilaginibacter lappiensis]MBB6108800.1 hypothetical protein [Mucilaginibacter lappiensis]MBB6126941.1 hypothetical protein [Mucilaginibacter lappiensis]SIQ62732.1 Protein of unknown function [Mucilaginibacter lappiensis]